MERLRGAARLLSEMVEPILKTATQISILLARTFFMGFSLMILAVLARVRVLIQQMLLDVVSVFNEMSSLAQKKQSIKITQDGVEVFREYYPMMEEIVTLECIWKTDKFELVERCDKVETRHDSESLEGGQTIGTSTKYQSIGAIFEDDEPDPTETGTYNGGPEGVSSFKRKRTGSPVNISNETNQIAQAQILSLPEDDSGAMPRAQNITLGGSSITNSKKVAFISVSKPAPKASNVLVPQVIEAESKQLLPLFNLFSEDDSKGSIF